MDDTVLVALLGFIATVVGTGLGGYWQRASSRASRMFAARLAALQELSGAIYEYERATYDRVKSRMDASLDDRASVRQ